MLTTTIDRYDHSGELYLFLVVAIILCKFVNCLAFIYLFYIKISI